MITAVLPGALLVVVLPALAALPAYFLRRARTLEMLAAVGACGLVMLMLAWPAERISWPGVAIDVGAPLSILGREMRARAADRAAIALLFGCAAVLFGMTWRVRQGWTFVPVGLLVLAFLSAAILIRPFVFSALAIEAAAALLVLMVQTESDEDNLSRPAATHTLGAMRLLTVATLALPMFLAASFASLRAGGAGDAVANSRAAVLLACGAVLLLGAFPIFTWTHPVARDAPPLTTAFIASVVTGALVIVCLSLRQEFTLLATDTPARAIFQAAGVISIAFGGALGWAQKSFGRVLACALCVDAGATLLLLAAPQPLGVEALTLATVSRALSIGILGIGLALLREHAADDGFDTLRGVGPRHKLALLAVAIGGLSMVGLPGTVGFVARWVGALTVAQGGQTEALFVLVLAVGSVGIGLTRGIAALMDERSARDVIEAEQAAPSAPASGFWPRMRRVFGDQRRAALIVGGGVVAIVLLGLYPSLLGQFAKAISSAYTFYR